MASMESRTGPTMLRWSWTFDTPSSPATALVIPLYSSGSFRVIQIDSARSSSFRAALTPLKSSS